MAGLAKQKNWREVLISKPELKYWHGAACCNSKNGVDISSEARSSPADTSAVNAVVVADTNWEVLMKMMSITKRKERKQLAKNQNCPFLHQCLLWWIWRIISLKSHIWIVFTIFSWFVEIVHILPGLSYGFKDFRKLIVDIVSQT